MFSPIIVLGIFMIYSIHIGELAFIIERYIVKVEAINLDEYYKISSISVTNLTHFHLSCGYEGDCLMGTCHYRSPNSLDAPTSAVTYKQHSECKPSNKCYCVGDTTQKPESVTVIYDNKLHVKIMRSSSMAQTIRNNDSVTLELYFMTPSCEITNLAFYRGLKSLYDDKWIYPLIKNVPPPKGWSHSTVTKMTLTMTNVQVTDNGYYEMKIQCGMVIVNYPFLLYVLSNFTDGGTTRLTVNVTVTDKPFFSETLMASGKSKVNIILIILVIIICLLAILGAVQTRKIWQDRKLKSRLSNLQRDIHSRAISLQNLLPRLKPFNRAVVNNLYIDPEQYIEKQLLTIELDKPLGAGCFGLVYQGLLRCDYQNDPLPVAVKTPKSSDHISHYEALIAELTIMSNIGSHVNLLRVYGAIIENLHLGQLFVVFEICEKGSLLSYIKSKHFVNECTLDYQNVNFDRHTLSEETTCLSDNVDYPFSSTYIFTCNLLQYAYQIAAGMDYISRYVIHRDLALCNILLTDNDIVKIADFGLALDFSPKVSNVERLPIKWMPPEAIWGQEFSTRSDVWSFGVVLWELFTLGQEPFEDCRIFNLETMESFCNQLISGRRLNCPMYSPPEIYTLMKECWSIDKEDRPSFEECKSIIGCYLSEKFPSATNVLINLLRNSQPYVDVRRSRTRQTISPENYTYLTVIEENVYVNDNPGD